MTIQEAMRARHTVRRYLDRPIDPAAVARLRARLEENNRRCDLGMELVTGSEAAFGPLLRAVLARGVQNYIVLAGPEGPDVDERLGWCGADMALFAQTLGLNSWWVAGTYNKSNARRAAGIPPEARMTGIIALGYGATQGVPHKSKAPGDIASYDGEAPDWFTAGVEAVLLAPTALNRQAFTIRGAGDTVKMTCQNGAFSGTDLGIGKYHFTLGAGEASFRWA